MKEGEKKKKQLEQEAEEATTIQKQNRNSIARTLNSFKNDSMDKLNDLVSKYNVYKSSPIQVYGSDKNNIA